MYYETVFVYVTPFKNYLYKMQSAAIILNCK